MQVKVVNGTSKNGKSYSAIQVTIGEYEARLFPSRAEMAYIKSYISEKSHKDFKGDDVEGE